VALISRGFVALTLEDMAKMTTAIGADNLRSLHAKRVVHMSGHSPRNGVEVCRPSTARLELVVSSVKWRIATGAFVDALGWVVGIIFPCAGTLGTLFAENAELLCNDCG
jgi:hypothetical protein